VLVGFAVSLCGMANPSVRPPPSLGLAASFAVLGGSAVNAGTSTITGNLGVSPGKTITGKPTVKLGAIYRDDAIARQAQKDSAAAYKDLASRTCVPLSTATPAPDVVYCLSSLVGTLTLDARGNPDAFWIFQSTTTLITAADSSVRVINGGFEGNVFWQVGDSATLGERTAFAGNILAQNDITLQSGASLSGRALALTGVVTLSGNDVSLCCKLITLAPATLADGKVCVPYGPTTITASGGTGSYEFSVPPGALPDGLSLSPAGVLSRTPSKVVEKTFTVTAKDKMTGCLGKQDYKVGVTCDVPFTFSPADLPAGTVGLTYPPTTISAIDGPCVKGPLVFTPNEELTRIGMDLSRGGVLSGTPLKPGDFKFVVTVMDEASGCVGTREYTVRICPVITISPMTLPNATVGKDYSARITASGGTAPYTFSVTPNPPAPLTLTKITPTTAVISGKPTAKGDIKFTITATDNQGCSGTRDYTVSIVDLCPTISLSPDPLDLPDAVPEVPYKETTIKASGGTEPYTFTTRPNTLPDGLTLSTGGLISKTPTEKAVSSNFTVHVTDKNSCTGEQTYRICLPIIILPATLPDANAGVPYPGVKLTATGGAGPDYEFSPPNLPCGLKLSPDGVISGTPSSSPTPPAAAGYTPLMPPSPGCTFTVTAVDKVTGCKGMRTYGLRVRCPAITISPLTLPDGNVGTLYSQMITASGGAAPYTFAVSSGSLPPGVTLASGGLLTGMPTTTGTYCFWVGTTDAAGCTGGPVAYTIVINAASCPAGTTITLSPSTLPSAPTGTFYSQMITASGGTAPYTFSVTSGTLPPGLSLNPVTGVVSGVPTSGGRYGFTITATDANGCIGSTGCGVLMDVDIPALSYWAVAALSLLIAGVGVVTIRKE
jgi:hypothetical protein